MDVKRERRELRAQGAPERPNRAIRLRRTRPFDGLRTEAARGNVWSVNCEAMGASATGVMRRCQVSRVDPVDDFSSDGTYSALLV